MRNLSCFASLLFISVLSFTSFVNGEEFPPANPALAELKENFAAPGRDFSTGPLWTWNDLLTEEQIRSTMQDMAGQHVKQVWVHPRPGLMTPYLGDDWFKLWAVALNEAEKLDMNVWIYDENSYPSGFAGGFVPETVADSQAKGLALNRVKELNALDKHVWYVYKITKTDDGKESFENVTDWAKEQGKLPAGEWLIGKIDGDIKAFSGSGWFGGWWYTDLIKKGVTEKFIEITLEPYRKRFGDQFGKRLPGTFTDEPNLAAGRSGLTWNDEIPALFEQKFGYSIIDHLPAIITETGDWKRIRHNYYQLLNDLFIERWAKPYYDYCEKYGLEFTGHYWEHGWPGASHAPDNMAMYAWHQRPAIDTLMNQYNEGVHAQFGNARSVKELASVANQMGYNRTLSETYGAGGWDLRFEDMKRIADWQYALGVNTTNEHISYVTIRGVRKYDHPQSFSYHTPWWEAYHTLEDYHTRLQYALTRGEQINSILVIEPTTTAWMYQRNGHLGKIGNEFQNFVHRLEQEQVEYDLGCEDIITRWGKVENGKLVVNKRSYDLVILPANTENINGKVLELLTQYTKEKGTLICCSYPCRVDGVEKPDIKQMLGGSQVSFDDALAAAKKRTGQTGLVYNDFSKMVHHHRRILPDGGEILFFCNTDIEKPAEGTVVCSENKSVEQWNPETGTTGNYPFQRLDSGEIVFLVKLPPCGSLLLYVSNDKAKSTAAQNPGESKIHRFSPPAVKRLAPNVLTIDYVDVKVGEEERKEQYVYRADQWIWQKHGFGKNPWDNAVQFKDRLITKEFPSESGFTATYRFTMSGFNQVPKPLHLVIERSDLYTITCNGKSVSAKKDGWYLDKSFGKVDISALAKVGNNEVTITAKPMTMWSELAPAYLIGDFSLEPAEKGFVVKPAKPLTFVLPINTEFGHSSAVDGVAWLTSGIGYAPAGGKSDHTPNIVFDLGKNVPLQKINVWNYNEVNLTKRGVKEVRIFGSDDLSAGKKTLLGEFILNQGSSSMPQMLTLAKQHACRYVEFQILSNYAGVTYPVKEGQNVPDNAFVGLGEVRFIDSAGEVPNVTIANVSSELTVNNHDRRAVHLVDGSGLLPPEQGWHRQGMPFYMDGVSYTESFRFSEVKNRRFVLKLGKWYGSVAKVIVNGRTAGYIGYAPWELDVTDFVTAGKNEVSVVVIGTPKNLLGPHHNGKPRGSAWPSAFHQAPANQPSGSAYDVIGYGLFEPFTVSEQKRVAPLPRFRKYRILLD